MKTYVSTTLIQAEEMTEFQWRRISSNINFASKEKKHDDHVGYHLIYGDGSQAWIPKNIFEEMFHEYLPDERAVNATVYPSTEKTVFSGDDPEYGGAHSYQFLESIGFSKSIAGYVDSRQEIRFVKKEDDGTMTPGLQSEQIVIALIDRTQKLNAKYPSDQNKRMIAGLNMFLEACKERVQDRISRGVMGELKK